MPREPYTPDEPIDQRFELLFTKREKDALSRIAAHDRVSKAHIVRRAVRTQAKRKKLWK